MRRGPWVRSYITLWNDIPTNAHTCARGLDERRRQPQYQLPSSGQEERAITSFWDDELITAWAPGSKTVLTNPSLLLEYVETSSGRTHEEIYV